MNEKKKVPKAAVSETEKKVRSKVQKKKAEQAAPLQEGRIGDGKYRLITRSDFDGLVCAMLLKEQGLVGEIKFVHPKDMQDGKIEVSDRDITTNLPYVPGVYMSFDHHYSEALRTDSDPEKHVIIPEAPSAARVVYEYFGGEKAFPRITQELMLAVDQGDSADFSIDDILNPQGWALLNMLMDARTGLGRFRNFRISNYQLMMDLISYCLDHSIEDVLKHPDVAERIALYEESSANAKDQIKRCAKIYDNLVVLDLRNEETIWPTNRFMIYALFPEQNISIHVMWGVKQQNTVFATGKSIINKTSNSNIGDLMLEFGGGGHRNAGTCQVSNDKAEAAMAELIRRINKDG